MHPLVGFFVFFRVINATSLNRLSARARCSNARRERLPMDLIRQQCMLDQGARYQSTRELDFQLGKYIVALSTR